MRPSRTATHHLLDWYRSHRRDLPWRRTRDPYAVWISEIMLQQTRVAAAIPYYERFLARFPTVEALAASAEDEVLALWSGLGYYSRARNLRKAAGQVVERGGFPRSASGLRELAGIGDYTSAAIASICFDEPVPVLDGNVIRVLSRYTAEPSDVRASATRERLRAAAAALLDPRHPGESNQAMMELGATLCLPRSPQCLLCPLAPGCQALASARPDEFPIKLRDRRQVIVPQTLLLIERGSELLMRRRAAGVGHMPGFWEIPDAGAVPRAEVGRAVGRFVHHITIHRYEIEVRKAVLKRAPPGFSWVERGRLQEIPVTTVTRKSVELLNG